MNTVNSLPHPDSQGNVVPLFNKEDWLRFLSWHHRKKLETLELSFGQQAVQSGLFTAREFLQKTEKFSKACMIGFTDLLTATNWQKQYKNSEDDFAKVFAMFKEYMQKSPKSKKLSSSTQAQQYEAKIINLFEQHTPPSNESFPLEDTLPYSINEEGDMLPPESQAQ